MLRPGKHPELPNPAGRKETPRRAFIKIVLNFMIVNDNRTVIMFLPALQFAQPP
jgi:hypothetical protein